MKKGNNKCEKCKYRYNDYCVLLDYYIDFLNSLYCDSFAMDENYEDENIGFSIIDLEEYEEKYKRKRKP